MSTIRVFEPALCCNTGVCGEDPDQNLVTFSADLAHLQQQGIDIKRHNLANDPGAFASSEPVLALLKTGGSQGLPVTLVDGTAVQIGTYPSRDDLLRFAQMDDAQVADAGKAAAAAPAVNLLADASADAGCCGSNGCC